MYPHSHFLGGIVAGLVLKIFGMVDYWHIAIIAVLAVLLDTDHVIRYALQKGSWNPFKMWNNSVHKRTFNARSWLHHVSGLIIIGIVSIVLIILGSIWGIVIAAAYYSHMILDGIQTARDRKKVKRLYFRFILPFKLPYYEIYTDVLLFIAIGLLYLLFFF